MPVFKVLSFLGGGIEEETIELLEEHTRTVYMTVKELQVLFPALRKKDSKTLAIERDKIVELEQKADTLRRSIEENLYKGAFLPTIRSRILDFAEEVDNIADAAEDVAHITEFIEGVSHGKKLLDLMDEHLQKTVECVGSLVELEEHGEDAHARDLIARVRKKEHEADLIEHEIFRQIYAKKCTPCELMVQTKMVEYMASISDHAEEAADTLSLLLLTHQV